MSTANSASALIDARIAALADWRGELLSQLRAVILEADPGVTEEWKWDNPVWSHHGLICTGEAYQKAVKMTFAKGASLPDPAGLFNASLDGKVRRAIDFHEGARRRHEAAALTNRHFRGTGHGRCGCVAVPAAACRPQSSEPSNPAACSPPPASPCAAPARSACRRPPAA